MRFNTKLTKAFSSYTSFKRDMMPEIMYSAKTVILNFAIFLFQYETPFGTICKY